MKLSAFTKRLIERVITLVVTTILAWMLHKVDSKNDQLKSDVKNLEWGVEYYQKQ